MTNVAATEAKPISNSGGDKVARIPQRRNGRERVALILRAASDVIYERGYEATTMTEIAERSGTKIGSLYRFFPTKELVADALIDLYAEDSEACWQSLIAKAPSVTTEKLSDLLLSQYVEQAKQHGPLTSLLESRADGSKRRQEFRARNMERIAEILRAHAPYLKRQEAKKIGIVMFYTMRAFKNMTLDATAPNAPGALAELKFCARTYLVNRLRREPEGRQPTGLQSA